MSNRRILVSPKASAQAPGQSLVELTQGGSSLESGPSSSGPSHMSAIASSLPTPGTGAGLHSNLNPRLVNQQVRPTRVLSRSLFGPTLGNDVIIIISLTPRTPKILRFNSDLLRKHSPLLDKKLRDYGFTATGPWWFWIKIVKVDGAVKTMTCFTKDTWPNPETPSKFCVGDNPSDYEEDSFLQDLYIRLLETFHDNPVPVIAESIQIALKQCELYLQHAATLGITHRIQYHLSTVLLSYGIALYKAIATNPVPYILISHKLQNRQIYEEALIHLVGTFKYSPWPTSRDNLSHPIKAVVQRKIADLLRVVHEADLSMRQINLKAVDPVTGIIALPDSLKDHKTSVMVVTDWWQSSYFKDVDAFQLSVNRGRRMRWGLLFREVFHGTRDWMQFDPLRMERETGVRVLDDRVAQECIKRLQEKTLGIVRRLGISKLMIDPATNGIQYLTCVEVTNYDVPWEAEFVQEVEFPTHGLT